MSLHPPDAFVHLATYYRRNLTNLNYRDLLDSNINMPTRWLVLSLEVGCQTIVNTASYWQESDQPPHAATNLYASTKASFEAVIAGFVQSHALRAVTLRLFDVYGPDDPRPKIFTLIRNAMINKQSLDLSPGEQLHHFTHIKDVVNGYMHLLSNLEKYPPIQHHKFDLAGPRASLREAVAVYVDLFGGTPTLNWGALPYNAGQIHTPCLTSPLPGWFYSYDLRQGLQTLVE
ncbi:MAG: paratose synthase [Hyphobacterium sp.]|nr:MAG: paratose synthase [Hyphobacterium sp.]